MKKPVMPVFAVTLLAISLSGDLFALKTSDCLSSSGPEQRVKACTRAISAWKQADGNETMSSCYVARAEAYLILGQPQKALDDMDGAIDKTPRNPDLYVLRGIIYNRIGYYSRAITDFQKTIIDLKAGGKTGAWAYYNTAISYYLQGNSAEAQANLKRGKLLMPELYRNYQKEMNYFEQQKQAKISAAAAAFAQGKLFLEQNQPAQALTSFQAAAASDPANTDYQSWVGSLLCDMGKYRDCLQKLMTPAPTDRWNFYIAYAYMKSGMYNDAVNYFTVAETDKPPKNRGFNVTEQAQDYKNRIAAYQENYKKAAELGKAGRLEEAAKAASAAHDALDTEEVQTLIENIKKAVVAEKNSFRNKVITLVVFFMLGMAGFFIFKLGKILKTKRSHKLSLQREGFSERLLAKPPRDAYMSYLEYKALHPSEATVIAIRIKEHIACSLEFELIRSFIIELPEQYRQEYLILAAETYTNTAKYNECFDALQILNQIPYNQWGQREMTTFIKAHGYTDTVLLDPTRAVGGADIWSPDIPTAAYLGLANTYCATGDPLKAAKIIEQSPKYKWDDAYWNAYVRYKMAAGQIETIALADMPDTCKAEVLEEMFRRNKLTQISDYLSNEMRQKWRSEFYFYAFAIMAKKNAEDAWEIYKQMDSQYSVKDHSQVHYAIAVLCEKLNLPDRAAEIYERFPTPYNDSAVRLEKIHAGQPVSPTPDEILGPILPPNYPA